MKNKSMEEYHREELKQPDKPFNPLESGKVKHCDLFDRCLDNCEECLFNALYYLNPESGVAPNERSYGDLATNTEHDG